MTSYATSRLPPTVAAALSPPRMRLLEDDQRCIHAANRHDIAPTDQGRFDEEMLAHVPLHWLEDEGE